MSRVPIPAVTEAQRSAFLSRLVVTEGGCHEWSGSRTHNGYGHLTVTTVEGRFYIRAHRLAYAIAHGVDPGDRDVCHACDNPPCCNPDHLTLGTPGDNLGDMVVKGRHVKAPQILANMAKTHCVRDHPLSGDNVRLDAQGRRVCKACMALHQRNYRMRRAS